MSFCLALKHLRKARGLNQQELGKMVGVQQTYISALERPKDKDGKAGTEKVRRKLADALGWPYDAMVDLGAMLAAGEDPHEAERRALARCADAPPPPVVAEDLSSLVSFRVHAHGKTTKRTVFVDPGTIAGRNQRKISVHEVDGAIILVDAGDKDLSEGSWYLLKNPIRLRNASIQGKAVLLTSLEGSAEAHAGPWARICLGRALWLQMKLVPGE